LGLGEDQAARENFTQRARLFLVDNERGEHIEIRLGSERYALDRSSADGHFHGVVRLSVADVEKMTPPHLTPDGRLTYHAVTDEDDPRDFRGTVQLIGRTGTSVISDIDDTIKITEVSDRAAMLANTFLHDFEPVAGMAELYRRWAGQGARFHYVTASPWQLYEPVSTFLRSSGFPDGTYHMKSFRVKVDGLAALFGSPKDTKQQVIEAIIADFPNREFILVGDSGEKDPEIYGAVACKYRRQVARILIRNVTNEPAVGERFQRAFAGVPRDRWDVFSSAEEFPPKLLDLPRP
jgi:hypothetical protein